MNVQLITDSTCDLTAQEAKEMGVKVVPLKTLFQDKEYFDGIDLSAEEFYEKMERSKKLPTTTQPTPAAFEQTFFECEGSEIVVLLIAKELSGTVQSAQIANETTQRGAWIVDSSSATIGMRVLLLRAVALRDEGKSAKEIYDVLQEEKKKVRICAMVDTLENLKKGGRLSSTSAFAGTLLGIKPILQVKDGIISVWEKARGAKKAYDMILKYTKNESKIDFTKPVCLGYTGKKESFEPFYEFAKKTWNLQNPMVSAIGSVIGTHAGAGAVAIAYFED